MSSFKRLLLFGPVLWLRKVVLYLLIIIVVLGIVIYFVANSPLATKKLADSFAPDYNITYRRIHGNAITGVIIEDLRYNNQPMAEHIELKWNPSMLAEEEIFVNKAKIKNANIDTIKALIASFPDSEDNESSEPFAFAVKVDHVAISFEAFVEQNITFNAIELETQDFYYGNDNIDIPRLKLMIDSNISKIQLDASLRDGTVNVKELTLSNVDTLALENFFTGAEDNQSTSIEENETQSDEINPLIPKTVKVEKLAIDVLPRTFEPLQIKALSLSANDALFDVPTLVLQHAKVALNGNTNLSDIRYDAEIKENEIVGTVKLVPVDELFTRYDLPVRKEAIGDIVIDLNASKDQVVAKLNTQMKQVLKTEKDAFNMDIDILDSIMVYDLDKGVMKVDSKAMVSTPYAKNVAVSNLFMLDDNISYGGEVLTKQIIGIDAKFTKAFNDLHLKYSGDTQSIKTELKSENLQGTFVSSDFKNALLHLETLKEIKVSELVELPKELNQTKVNVVIDAPVSFDANASMARAKVSSNVVNIDANVSYKDMLEVKSVIDIPKTSLLKPYSEELKWDNLSPMKVDIILLDDAVKATVKSDALNAKAQYMLESTKVDGTINLGGLKVDISGIVEEKMSIKTNISSVSSLMESISNIYTLGEVPVVKGTANVSLELTEMKKLDLILTSPEISYHPDYKTEYVMDDIDVQVSMTESEVVLSRYNLTYAKQKLFATKPSKVLLKDDVVSIEELWVNDDLKVEGEYNLKTKQGTISTNANKLHIAHEIIDLDSEIDIKTVLDGNTTSVKGKIILLGGDIHYDMAQKTFASDSDIIIVQDMKEDEPSIFMDNLSVDIQIQTKKPLVYKKGNINMKANVDLGVHKAELSELMVLGTVELLKGGSYIFEDKRFILDKSFVHFTGNPNNPLLEVTVKYKSLNHLITVLVTGSADMPNINFSSKPSLSKEQILSIILFDSEGGAGTNSGEDMMKMMGGAMAKSALKDIGIKLDHLVLGSGNSVEVGKKLTNDITIIYVNDIVSSVKLKYEHSRRMESVISASEESQSYDIVYKRDFKAIEWW